MKNKMTAILLAIFLGGIGVHKFYLNRPFQGLMYLLFCWTFIPAALAVIDIIVLAMMSEQAFNAAFNYGGFPGQQFAQSQNIQVNIPAASSDASMADELTKLEALRQSGVLTDEEFLGKKQALLSAG